MKGKSGYFNQENRRQFNRSFDSISVHVCLEVLQCFPSKTHAYRSLQNCRATKQVQRSDDDPYFKSYTKEHITRNKLNHSLTTVPIQSSPQNQDSEHNCDDKTSA